MTTNLIIQYILVGLILLGMTVWVVVRIVRLRRSGKSGGCCGCSLSDACAAKNTEKNNKKDCCS